MTTLIPKTTYKLVLLGSISAISSINAVAQSTLFTEAKFRSSAAVIDKLKTSDRVHPFKQEKNVQINSFTTVTAKSDPIDHVYSFTLDNNAQVEKTFPINVLSEKNRQRLKSSSKRKVADIDTSINKPIVLHPEIEKIAKESPGKVINVIVTLSEDIVFPLFPSRDPGVSRTSKAGMEVLSGRRALMGDIKSLRKKNHRAFAGKFEDAGGKIHIKHHFTMANALTVEVSSEDVFLLAKQANVIHVRPVNRKVRPLNDGDPTNNLDIARMPMHLNSDFFFNSPNVPQDTFNYIGIIDTGIYSDHVLFEEQFATTIYAWDCVDGGDYCDDDGGANWDTEDCFEGGGHGTGVAALIQGNNSLGDQHRGVTRFGIDSYKTSTGCTQDDTVFVDADTDRAIEAAIVNDDWVLNMSLGANASVSDGVTAEQDIIALAADNAYNAGLVVVAASGNDAVLDCPGCAHKVISTGAYDVQTAFELESYSGRGPATDGRIKPDVIAPTCVETATNDGPSDLGVFCGTSGSAPLVSAVAMLTRSALENNVPNVEINEPGYNYAAMHMFARDFGFIDDDNGSGPVNMRGCGRFWFGKTEIDSSGDSVSIPMTLTPPYGNGKMKAAIWWPETASQNHNDIDLALISPTGITVNESQESESVFERVSGNGVYASSGTWSLQISGFDIQDGPQEVYFSASAGGCVTDFEQAP